MMTEQNNSPNEFDIFKVLKQHNKDKKNSSIIELSLYEIEKNIMKDVRLLNVSLSSAELRQNVVKRIQERIKYLEKRYAYWRNAKKAWACFFIIMSLLLTYWIFGKQVFNFLIDLVELPKNQVASNVDIPANLLLFFGLLTIILNSKFVDIIAESIWFMSDATSVQVLKGLEECVSFLEMQEDIIWILEKQSQGDDL